MSDSNKRNPFTVTGTSGFVIAIILSWTVNHSVFWAILHLFCGWFYIAYWVCKYSTIIQYIEQTLLK